MIINKFILSVISIVCYLILALFMLSYSISVIMGTMLEGNEYRLKENGGAIQFTNSIRGPYNIPATFELRFEDSISADILADKWMEAKGISNEEKEQHRTTALEQFRKKNFYLMNDTLVNKIAIKQPFPFGGRMKGHFIKNSKNGNPSFGDTSIPTHYLEENFLKVMDNDIDGKTYISVKSNRFWYNFLLALRGNTISIFGIYILLQILAIIKTLDQKINFSTTLSKKVRNLGWAFLIAQLIIFALSWVYSSWYHSVEIETTSTIQGFEPYISIHMKPMLEYYWYHFVIAGLLIVFSYLLKVGTNLKEDADLTV